MKIPVMVLGRRFEGECGRNRYCNKDKIGYMFIISMILNILSNRIMHADISCSASQ